MNKRQRYHRALVDSRKSLKLLKRSWQRRVSKGEEISYEHYAGQVMNWLSEKLYERFGTMPTYDRYEEKDDE